MLRLGRLAIAFVLVLSLAGPSAVAQAQQRTLRVPKSEYACLALSPDGRLLAAGGNKEVRVWDIDSGELLWSTTDHAGAVAKIVFSPDSATLASAGFGDDEEVRLRKSASGEKLDQVEPSKDRNPIAAFSPDGKLLYAGGDFLIDISSRRLGKGQIQAERRRALSCGSISADGKLVADEGGDRSITIWELESGKTVKTILTEKPIIGPGQFSPDGKKIATIDYIGSQIRIWDIETGKVVKIMDNDNVGECLAYSRDGSRIAAAEFDGVTLWDAAKGEKVGSWVAGGGCVRAIAFTPDGKTLIWHARDKVVLQSLAAK